ncbi:hypothetical protein BCD64_14190 [Nostoc sp. MBR 210]|nr:hypothetical protein BCD64_14190 [Nostoc sp. MBR 210]
MFTQHFQLSTQHGLLLTFDSEIIQNPKFAYPKGIYRKIRTMLIARNSEITDLILSTQHFNYIWKSSLISAHQVAEQPMLTIRLIHWT